MLREFSAGGVVVRRINGAWHIAVIEPQHETAPETTAPEAASAQVSSAAAPARRKKPASKLVLALPKGLIDEGEEPAATAVREVLEETGITATLVGKLTDIKYVYLRSWGDRQKVFKIVSFYLLRYQSGRVDDITPEMRIEVHEARWIPLEEAPKKLAYSGERQVVRLALQYLDSHPEV
jgi:8-oxo-dGTP pyrophosphatase MutT (NUDIX family)